MKLSVSNIAWSEEQDFQMYKFLQSENIDGIEIAPTRLFSENPYQQLQNASVFRKNIFTKFSLSISSIQSIWYGKKENLFSSKQDRDYLLAYTKEAILFAEQMQCGNLVFGCPKNRNIPPNESEDILIPFFRQLGKFAHEHHTCIAIEATPVIYGTNFLNTTSQVFNFVKRIKSKGIKVNLDIGAMLYNNEAPQLIKGLVSNINHVHISEPNLVMVQDREFHHQLASILIDEGYSNYISLEIKNLENIETLKSAIIYLKTRFK